MPSESRVRVTVSDNGVGLPQCGTDRLFEPFYTTKSNGMGLGLAICKELVELMGGTIGVETTPGKGSVFWFTFRTHPEQCSKH